MLYLNPYQYYNHGTLNWKRYLARVRGRTSLASKRRSMTRGTAAYAYIIFIIIIIIIKVHCCQNPSLIIRIISGTLQQTCYILLLSNRERMVFVAKHRCTWHRFCIRYAKRWAYDKNIYPWRSWKSFVYSIGIDAPRGFVCRYRPNVFDIYCYGVKLKYEV